MKTLFLSMTCIGLIYLILQSSAGQAWINKFNTADVEQVNQAQTSQAQTSQAQTSQAQIINQLHQELAAFKQLKHELIKRVEYLESELEDSKSALVDQVIEPVAISSVQEKGEQIASNQNVLIESHKQPVALDKFQQVDTKTNINRTNDRKHAAAQQAQLRDVINKMELASLSLLTQ